MVTLRSRRVLSCFYCGRKSKLHFEGQAYFDCSNCEARNWLDEHGDITDPPSASVERDRVQYAIPRSASARSPSPSVIQSENPDDSIFCAKCLRNQHMLTSSLAQFEWPDESSAAEYAARESRYFALRKDLEKRYPQVCSECAPRVEKRMRDASYTAQTDHLKRMMDRTRSHRKEVKRMGILDAVDIAGKWSWYVGFALQFTWHAITLGFLLLDQFDPGDDGSWISTVMDIYRRIPLPRLPALDWYMHWAINLGMCSFIWNPHFKQMIRGFTAHILGFRQWYTYQLLILFTRFICLSMTRYVVSNGLLPSAQLAAQGALVFVTFHVYRAAKKSIRTDTRPLFRPTSKAVAAARETPPVSATPRKDSNDLGNVLDEIMDSPLPPKLYGGARQNAHNPDLVPRNTYNNNNNNLAGSFNRPIDIRPSNSSFTSLRLDDPRPVVQTNVQPAQITHYDEEMDWSPSASQHRAFSSYNPYKVKNTNPRFSDTPIEPKTGPIWYKVPPAPTNPAQRLRNPPIRGIIRESPKEIKESIFQPRNRTPVDMGVSNHANSSSITFADPKFHAPQAKDDPRDNLSQMFASSFNISPSPEANSSHKSNSFGQKSQTVKGYGSNTSPTSRVARFGDLVMLFVALCCWIYALDTEETFGPPVALASICVCLIVSIRLAVDLYVEIQLKGKGSSILTSFLLSVATTQIIGAFALMWQVWSDSSEWNSYGKHGTILFGGMIVHHMWHVFV